METSTYTIEGMTCQACVKTVTDKIFEIPGVRSAQVDLETKTANITGDQKVQLSQVASVLSSTPKYKAVEYNANDKKTENKESLLKTYKPLITIFTVIFLTSISYQISLGAFNSAIFMNHVMAGFFIGLSLFKFLDLKAFSESFSSYDPLAQRWLGYGTVYPFVELALGLLFIAGKMLLLANMMTILILSLTTYGVYLRLQSKSKFQCACLGTTFNLPLSNVTIGENVVMIVMAIYNIALM